MTQKPQRQLGPVLVPRVEPKIQCIALAAGVDLPYLLGAALLARQDD